MRKVIIIIGLLFTCFLSAQTINLGVDRYKNSTSYNIEFINLKSTSSPVFFGMGVGYISIDEDAKIKKLQADGITIEIEEENNFINNIDAYFALGVKFNHMLNLSKKIHPYVAAKGGVSGINAELGGVYMFIDGFGISGNLGYRISQFNFVEDVEFIDDFNKGFYFGLGISF